MAFLFAVCCSATPLPAQVGGGSETHFQWDGGDKGYFGMSVSNAGDINQDGIEDVMVGSPYAKSAGALRTGVVIVYSGLDGTQLMQIDGLQDGETFGRAVSSAGDMDGDGIPDIAVGAMWSDVASMEGAGAAYVFSGANGSLMYQWNGHNDNAHFARDLSNAGDLNQDGFDDLIVGERYAHLGSVLYAGSVYAYSGADGSILFQWDGFDQHGWFGQCVSGIDDVNGDGAPDVLIGASGTTNTAYVYSGLTGLLLYQVSQGPIHSGFGNTVSNAGDIDGDSIEDFLVGADNAAPGGLTDAGSVFVFSGVNGALLFQVDGSAAEKELGHSLSSAGDFNGDGHADFLASSNGSTPTGDIIRGEVDLYSGADGSLIYRWESEDRFNQFGTSVSSTGDIDGDGFPEILVGDFFVKKGGALRSGSASLLSFKPFLTSDQNTISVSSGGTLTLENDFPNTAGGHDFKVLMSATGTGPSHYGVDIPLTQDGLVLDTFAGIYPFATPTNMHGTLDASGDATSTLAIAGGLPSNLIGRSIYVAAIANPTGQLPEFSSAVIRIEVTP